MAINWGSVLGAGIQGLASGGVLGGLAGGVMGAVASNAAGTGTAGVRQSPLIGGTVIDSGGGLVKVKTLTNRIIVIKRKKHRRSYRHRSGGGMNSMLKQAMQFKMLSQAMK